jgi:hypothetical protein
MQNERQPPVLKLIVFIVDWTKTKIMSAVFENAHVRFHFVCKGRGTASSDVLDALGIGSTEKAVVLALEQDILVPALVKDVGRKLGLHNPGAGIAFTVPLSGINSTILRVFKQSVDKVIEGMNAGASAGAQELSDARENDASNLNKENEKMSDAEKSPIRFDLIVSIINQGYSEEFMTVAREAGAGGGTVINARGLMHKGPVKFFGITVQDEKEIIIILSTREKKTPIMAAVSKAYGITTKAEGIVFSVPVDSITGIDLR